MVPSHRPSQDATPRSVLAIPALVSIGVGMTCATLLGIWIFAPAMKEFSGPTMKANTALGMVLGSAALWLLRFEHEPSRLSRRWGSVLAGAIVVIGALTCFEYSTGWDLGIDQLIADDFIMEESRRFR